VTSAVLLDTHVLLWALAEPERLSPNARALLSDRRVDVWVSSASAWEIATKHRIGKLPGASRIVSAFPQHLDRLGARALAITAQHAVTAGAWEWDHRDPFDRMLAAQSTLEALPLMTGDPVFASRTEITVVPA
jgi:PIN domain nuclease of toxin-antitoxin system